MRPTAVLSVHALCCRMHTRPAHITRPARPVLRDSRRSRRPGRLRAHAEHVDVVVVGAGIIGLSVALELLEQSQEVSVAVTDQVRGLHGAPAHVCGRSESCGSEVPCTLATPPHCHSN